MSKVRRKPARAVLCLVLAFVAVFTFLLAASAVFADTSTSKVDSHVYAKGVGQLSKVRGSVNFNSNAVDVTKLRPVKNSNNEYEGRLHISVESTDLFGQSYQLYQDRFENEKFGNASFKNLVMSDLGEDGKAAFPTIEYTVTFPDTVKVAEPIKAETTTSTISKINVTHPSAQKVHLSMNLGNWNDYGEFFNLLKAEYADPSSHTIDITIPFVVKASDYDGTQKLGNITGTGYCSLYKFWKIISPTEVVNVTSDNTFSIDDAVRK
jgi:hypothetical protein